MSSGAIGGPVKPYKFVVQAVPQRLDDDGNVIGELETQPVVLFGCEALEQWARDFPVNLAAAAEQNAG